MTVNIASSADLPAALKVVNASLAPASAETIEEWLAVLSVKTVPRVESAIRADLTLSVYTAQLRSYPADVVRYVLTGWSGKWWPTWGELAERLDEMTEPRLMIRDRVLGLIEGDAPIAKPVDPIVDRIAKLRDDLAAAERIAVKYPELTDSSQRKAEAIAEEIEKLEAAGEA